MNSYINTKEKKTDALEEEKQMASIAGVWGPLLRNKFLDSARKRFRSPTTTTSTSSKTHFLSNETDADIDMANDSKKQYNEDEGKDVWDSISLILCTRLLLCLSYGLDENLNNKSCSDDKNEMLDNAEWLTAALIRIVGEEQLKTR
jgi:hypothetical protein